MRKNEDENRLSLIGAKTNLSKQATENLLESRVEIKVEASKDNIKFNLKAPVFFMFVLLLFIGGLVYPEKTKAMTDIIFSYTIDFIRGTQGIAIKR